MMQVSIGCVAILLTITVSVWKFENDILEKKKKEQIQGYLHKITLMSIFMCIIELEIKGFKYNYSSENPK